MASFSEQLIAFAQTAEEMETEEAAGTLTRVFEAAAEQMGLAMQQQGINRQTTDDVVEGLMAIFGIEWSELPDELRYSDDDEAATEDNEYEETEDEILGSGGKGSTNDANPEFIAWLRAAMEKYGVVWQSAELGKVDAGGGGTVAKFIAQHNIETIDLGVAVISMHAPYEVVSKVDVYETHRAIKAFYCFNR